ncbi:MAG TPA: hypothetical protein VJ546_06440 [Bacillales bacterium]|nr:hypothetical protein [Bacillales bacterium]
MIGAEGAKTPRKCYRISFVRGQFQGSKINVLGDQRFRRDPAGACDEEAQAFCPPESEAPGVQINKHQTFFYVFLIKKIIAEKIPPFSTICSVANPLFCVKITFICEIHLFC